MRSGDLFGDPGERRIVLPGIFEGAVATCVGKAFGDLRLGEVTASCGEVNDLIGSLFAYAFPAVDFTHRNLTGSQQSPE
jgi:hypothetical protein